MIVNPSIFRLRLAIGLTALLPACFLFGAVKAEAAPKCPVCRLEVLADTPTTDNRVTLRQKGTTVDYRCVYCAVYQANNNYPGDLTITAASEKKGKPIVLTRKGTKWTASPATAIFVMADVEHKHCQTGYKALTNRAAYNAFVKKNKAILRGAAPKPLNVTQMVQASK